MPQRFPVHRLVGTAACLFMVNKAPLQNSRARLLPFPLPLAQRRSILARPGASSNAFNSLAVNGLRVPSSSTLTTNMAETDSASRDGRLRSRSPSALGTHRYTRERTRARRLVSPRTFTTISLTRSNTHPTRARLPRTRARRDPFTAHPTPSRPARSFHAPLPNSRSTARATPDPSRTALASRPCRRRARTIPHPSRALPRRESPSTARGVRFQI